MAMPDPISSQPPANACFAPETEELAAGGSEPPASSMDLNPANSTAIASLVHKFGPGPGVPLQPTVGATDVLLCHRIADIPLNSVPGFEHFFIVTSLKAGGAGHCGDGIPGHGHIDLPLSPMCINDHAAEVGAPGVTCEPTNADADCVDQALEFGKPLGPWAPPFNDCQTFAADVIAECSRGTSYATGGAEGAPGASGEGGTLGY